MAGTVFATPGGMSTTARRELFALSLVFALGTTAACTEEGGGAWVPPNADDGGTEDEVGEADEDGTDGGPIDELPSPTLPDTLLDYSHDLPDHFLTAQIDGFDNTPGDNPVTDAGATLGRVLFWDKRLSQNGAVACGSCHGPGTAFTDDAVLSEGFEGALTRRNSMPLINLAYYDRGAMFWDERADTLEDQVLMPIQDAGEMGLTLDELVERVEDADYYAPLFTAAFGDAEVTTDRISKALAQFVRSIVSYRSPWDEGVAMVNGNVAQDFPNYSAQENQGKAIFFGQSQGGPPAQCGACHMQGNAISPPPPGMPQGDNAAIFYGPVPANNGLIDDEDDGFGEVTGDAQNNGEFKSPSLRNVAMTGPYMHDGRFDTLAEVVDHYVDGVEDHPNLHPLLRDPMTQQPVVLNLDDNDKAALVAFLETLSDPTLAADERWSSPF